MIIIGITGSIGCGKSTLARNLKKIGENVYNPDIWVKNLYMKKDFLEIIKKNFPQVFDEKNNFYKRKLREIVFNNAKELKKLEGIIHPILKERLKKIIRRNSRRENIIFLDVALLYEMNWDKYCDYVVVVDVDEKIQKNRVIERDHIKEEDFYKIVKQQMPQSEKIKRADFVINTAQKENVNLAEMIRIVGMI